MSEQPTPSPTHVPAKPRGLVTFDDLVMDLIGDKVVTPSDVISLLGDQRNARSVNVLELALVRNNVISREELLRRKAALGGLPPFPGDGVRPNSQLPEAAAAQHGALVLNISPLTVAMVEPTPTNLRAVASLLGTERFAVRLTTAPHFAEQLAATYRRAVVGDLKATPDLFAVLDEVIARGASDLHLKVGLAPRLRVDGSMIALEYRQVDQLWMRRAVEEIVSERHQSELARKFSTDFAYAFGNVRFRVNTAKDAEGTTMVMRRLPTQLPTADELSLPPAIRKFAHLERGLVLVTGPTGSGKSTTLAAILNEIVHTSARHIITLEDPIEFRFPTDQASLVNQRELGSSFASFPEGIRDALRQDPDVMLVGELRDLETVRAALELANTGHLVFGSLHTADAPSTVSRVVNLFPSVEQDSARTLLAQMLKGCVSQTLLPRATRRGRVAAFETLVHTPAIATSLAKVDGASSLKQTMQSGKSEGMCTMETSLAQLVHDGVVTPAEARFRAQNVEEFDRHIKYLAKVAA